MLWWAWGYQAVPHTAPGTSSKSWALPIKALLFCIKQGLTMLQPRRGLRSRLTGEPALSTWHNNYFRNKLHQNTNWFWPLWLFINPVLLFNHHCCISKHWFNCLARQELLIILQPLFFPPSLQSCAEKSTICLLLWSLPYYLPDAHFHFPPQRCWENGMCFWKKVMFTASKFPDI